MSVHTHAKHHNDQTDSTAVSTAGAKPVSPHAWVAVALSMFAIAWGGNEFTPLLVMYRGTGEFSAVAVDALLAAYVFGIVPALLIGGPLSDRYGRRPLLLPGAPIAFAGSLIISLTSDSEVGMFIGRVFCGIALGLVMAVGTTWIKELSDAAGAGAAAGARRASLSLTLGFLVGAGVAAVLAQFAPLPDQLSYFVHMALTLVTGLYLLSAPETRHVRGTATTASPATKTRLIDDLKVPKIAHKRFLLVVLPAAPWVFGCAGSAYAVLPGLLAQRAGDWPIAFAGLITVLTLGCGVGIQVLGPVIDTRKSARATVIAMSIVVIGMGLGGLAAVSLNLAMGLVAAMVLGLGYGLALVSGLSEVQRIAGPDDLAGLNAVLYSVTYTGFFVPMVLAWAAQWLSYPQMFLIGLGLAAVCLAIIASAWSRHLPGAARLDGATTLGGAAKRQQAVGRAGNEIVIVADEQNDGAVGCQ